jgi:hypothetical protein
MSNALILCERLDRIAKRVSMSAGDKLAFHTDIIAACFLIEAEPHDYEVLAMENPPTLKNASGEARMAWKNGRNAVYALMGQGITRGNAWEWITNRLEALARAGPADQ